MKVTAAIDIGTNTARLMIGELIKGKGLKTLRREAMITRLGEDVNETSSLKEEAVERTLRALSEYKSILEQTEVEKMVIAATSAVRDAKNSDIFLNRVEQLFGTEVKVLSGEQEAQLAFLGATHDIGNSSLTCPACSEVVHFGRGERRRRIPHPSSLTLVLDIGGGSTELILGEPPDIRDRYSLDIGSVRLTEMFLKNDPPTDTEVRQTKQYIYQMLAPVSSRIREAQWWPGSSKVNLIGVAGTITTISAVKQGLATYNSSKIHHSRLSYADIDKISEAFLSTSLVERKEIIGLETGRADIIVAGTLIAISVMEVFDLCEIIVSECDILDGLILSFSHFKTMF